MEFESYVRQYEVVKDHIKPTPRVSLTEDHEPPNKGIIKGSLSTPLTETTYVRPSKPSWDWTQEDIEKEELRVRAAFMRASVDYRKKLKEMNPERLHEYFERERDKLRNRQLFDSYQKCRKIGLTLQSKAVHARNKKESDFLDEKIAEMTKEAERMKKNLEKQVIDYEKLQNPTARQTVHIEKVKAWLEKFPSTMSNLQRSQAQRKKEMEAECKKMGERSPVTEETEEPNRSSRKRKAVSSKKICKKVKKEEPKRPQLISEMGLRFMGLTPEDIRED